MSAVAESYEVQRANRRFIEQSFRTPMLERRQGEVVGREHKGLAGFRGSSGPGRRRLFTARRDWGGERKAEPQRHRDTEGRPESGHFRRESPLESPLCFSLCVSVSLCLCGSTIGPDGPRGEADDRAVEQPQRKISLKAAMSRRLSR